MQISVKSDVDKVLKGISVFQRKQIPFAAVLGLTNIVQYIWRCFDKGDTLTDLKKARWYLNRLIDEVEKETG